MNLVCSVSCEENENLILELGKLIRENKILRRENSDLRLRLAADDAFISSLSSGDAGEYEFLNEIIRKNGLVDLCRSAGWKTSEDRVENWEIELERFRAGRAKL